MQTFISRISHVTKKRTALYEKTNSPFLENAFPFSKKHIALFRKRPMPFFRYLPSGWSAWRYGSASDTQVSLKNARYRTVYQ